MSSYDEITSPQATDWEAPYLHPFVIHYASREHSEILGHTFQSMTHQQELLAKVPTDINECIQTIQM